MRVPPTGWRISCKITDLTESLFADDKTIFGRMRGMETGKREMVRVLKCFEEKYLLEKEEELRFEEESAERIRMLGVFIGRGVDMEERHNRMTKSNFKEETEQLKNAKEASGKDC